MSQEKNDIKAEEPGGKDTSALANRFDGSPFSKVALRKYYLQLNVVLSRQYHSDSSHAGDYIPSRNSTSCAYLYMDEI